MGSVIYGRHSTSPHAEFLDIYTNSSDHSETKRERWTASLTYIFRHAVQNGKIRLDLTTLRFRADLAS